MRTTLLIPLQLLPSFGLQFADKAMTSALCLKRYGGRSQWNCKIRIWVAD
jgi:hypothetical protein